LNDYLKKELRTFFFSLENQKSQEKNEAEQVELIPGEQSK